MVKVSRYCPGQRYAVVGTGASADFIHEHKASIAQVVQYGGRFIHLDHEGRGACADVVAGSDARKQFVYDAHLGRLGRNKASGLCQDHAQCGLSKQGRLSAHIGAGDHHDLLLLGV